MTNELTPADKAKLVEQIRKAETIAELSKAELAVCIHFLEKAYSAMDSAIATKNLADLHRVSQRLLFSVPDKNDIRRMAEDLLHSWRTQGNWLDTATKSLETIEELVAKLNLGKDSENEEIRKRILATIREGLIPHI
jgi:hypothetical protein